MLYFDAAIEIASLTLYRDYADKTRYYYMPKSPRLSVENGQPMFQLLMYRDVAAGAAESTGGGFLAMTVDLGVPPATLEKVSNELAGRVGAQVSLVPLPVKSGTVRVIALDSGRAGAGGTGAPRFIEDMVASGNSSGYGDQRSVFTTELSKKGAVMMRAALEGEGATPIVVIYDLRFVGLLPAYDVTITIKFSQTFHHLRSRAQMNTLWFKSDIDQETESLMKSGAIKINEVVYETETTEQTAARQQRLIALAKELAQWTFFKPGINPGTVLAQDRGTLQAFDSTQDLAKITAGLTSTSRAALTGVGATEDVGTPRRPGTGVATDALESRPAGGAPAGAATAPATTQPAESAQPQTAVEAWNRAGRPQGAFLLRSLEQDERQEIEFQLRQVAAVERSIAPQGQIRMLEGATGIRGRILEVDLNADFFKTIGGKVSTTADLAALGIASAIVKLRYGTRDDGRKWKDTAEFVLAAAGDSQPYRFSVDRLNTQELEFQVVLNFKPNSAIGSPATKEESPWQATTTRDLDINPLAFSSIIQVHLVAAMVDWNLVRQIQARVEYIDQASGINVADTKLLSKDAPNADVRIRPKNASVRNVTAHLTFFYADGTSEPPITMTQVGDEPFVINQPPASTVVVDTRLSDILARYKRITVQMGRPDSNEVARTVNLGDAVTEAQWAFRRQNPRDTNFRYRVTAFLKDGAVREEDWVTTDNPLVIVGDRAAGVLNVQVMILGSLADAGLRMAKVRLNYPDAPKWADPDIDLLFRTGTEEFVWRVPMAKPDATSYTYQVTWFTKDGKTKQTELTTTKDEILLLDPLAV